ncbi:MAG: two-component regulator propeller domain-containing protein, partial [Holophaga sp.]
MKQTVRVWLLWFVAALGLVAQGASPILKAPPGSTAFRSFGVDQGLTNPSTTAMTQDHEGFFWVGTEDGLFRLEGDKFRRFGETDGLPSARIDNNGLSVGKTHGLWIGTSRGLAFWNGQRFLRPSAMGLPGKDDKPSVSMPQGGVILSDKAGNTRYLGVDGDGFIPLDGLPWGNGLTACNFQADQDLLYMALGQDLWLRHKGAWTHRDLTASLGQDIRVIWVDTKGQIWLRCTELLARMANLNAPVERIPTPLPLASINSANLGVDNLGRLWTNAPQGLMWLDGQTSGVIGLNEGLPQGGAVVLCVDRQNSIWIGGEGCHKLLGQGLWTGWTRKQGLPTDVVWSITRTRDGLLWAGTAAGLAVGDERGWKSLPQTHGNQFMALEEDADGNLWVGHLPSTERRAGLSVRTKGSLDLKMVPLPGLPPEGSVSTLLAEGSTLWIGTGSMGLLKATRTGIKLQVEPITIGNWPRLDSINRVISDGKQGLWVSGTHGLAHWDGRTWAMLDKATGLPEDAVLMVAAMPNGDVWANFTDTLALVRVRREGANLKLLETLRAPHPLVKNPIVTMVSRPDGLLWLGTSRGLLRWDGQRLERYGRHTGFPGEDCAQNGIWFDPNGDIWVGLSVGMVRGRLSLRSGDQTPPPAQVFLAQRGDGRSFLAESADRQIPWP